MSYIKNLFSRIALLSISTLMVLCTGCNKLDMKPTDSIDPDKAFRNLEDVNMGILGAYAVLDYTLIANNVTVSDEAVVPGENTVSNTDAYRWLYTPSSGSVTSAFGEYYRAIDRANRVLAALEQLEVAPGEQALTEHYKGELLGIRAFCHLQLLSAFAESYQADAMGVPYMVESQIGYPARDSFGEVMRLIQQDLETAASLMSADFEDQSRITRLAVRAIQARASLYNKDWEQAIDFATDVIEQVPLADASEFAAIWTDESNAEVIWELARAGTTDSRIGGFFFREDGGVVLYAPSFKLISQFDRDKDVRFSNYILHDPDRGADKSPYLVSKYLGGDASAPGLADIKLFRVAEMYLIRAEAYAETGGLDNAATDLNTLRAKRISGYLPQSYGNKEALIQAVYTERLKELAFEGHRFFDLKRRSMDVERAEEDADNTSGAMLLTPEDAAYSFPIPADEISVNENMIQNPKY